MKKLPTYVPTTYVHTSSQVLYVQVSLLGLYYYQIDQTTPTQIMETVMEKIGVDSIGHVTYMRGTN